MPIAIGVSSKGRTGSAASIATTGVSTQASGSVIAAGMIFQNTFSSVTDSKSNSPYQQISVERVFSGATGKARMYFFPNATGGASHTVTGTVSGGVTAITVLMAEITGSSGIDTGATSVIDAATPFSTSITPTAGNRLVLAFLAGDSASNPATHAESNGFTILTSAEETNGASFWEGVLAYKIVACDGVTPVTVSFTDSGAANCAVYLAAFIESSTGGGARLSNARTRTGPYRFRKPTLAYADAPPSGVLAGTATLTFAQTGAIAGDGVLAGSATLTFAQGATVAANGALAVSATLSFAATAVPDMPSGDVSGTVTLTFGQSGALTGPAALAGTTALTLGQTAAVAGAGALAGAAALTFNQVGATGANGALSASTTLTFAASGTLDQPAGEISGVTTITFGQSGALDQPLGSGDGGGNWLLVRRRRARV